MKSAIFALLLGFSISCAYGAAVRNDEICYITNIDFFVEQCPTLDPAIDEILSDFRITRDGVDIGEVQCEEPISALPLYTTELRLLQSLRIIYYIDKGRTGHLPWTDKSLYDWLKSKVGGFNINSNAANNSCCGAWPNGDRFITLTELKGIGATDPSFRSWPNASGGVKLIMHEARHIDGFGHVGCCPNGSGGCDQRYDESNLSPYAIQWWLEQAFLDGTLYTGFGCLNDERIFRISGHLVRGANNRRNLFCENPPPVLVEPALGEEASAPCLDCQPPGTLIAMDDGPYTVDEGGRIDGQQNILDNDLISADETPAPFLGMPPAHASFFELRSDGSFDYTHDGTETTSDSFTYRLVSENIESEDAVVSLVITPVNDAPTINLVGSSMIELTAGDSFEDPGATADDAEDGDISESIVVGGDAVDANTAATYVITYDVADSEGLAAEQVTRTITVNAAPMTPPRKQKGGGLFGLWELISLAVAGLFSLLRSVDFQTSRVTPRHKKFHGL